jgi:hypothetical protein
MTSPIGSFSDKLKVLRLRRDALQRRLCGQAGGGERTMLEVLQTYGFSPAMQQRFFQPFLSGVFLDEALSTPCRLFELVWAAFSCGDIALPQQGMGAIASQLAATLPTMDPATRIMKVVTVDDAQRANEAFEILMGSEVAPRKKFIQTNAKNVKDLDV